MTIKDIARLARVSVSTVSRSLNDSAEVSPETRRRVLEIARKVGFEQNAGARSLVTRRVGTIGVILPDDFDQFTTQLYHSSLHNHLRRSLERSDFDLIVGFSRNRSTGENSIRKLVNRRKVDGLILIVSSIDEETEHYLKELDMPYVYAHYPPATSRGDVDWVYVDHFRGGMLVGDFFLRQGYRRVAAVGNTEALLEFEMRMDGLQSVLRRRDEAIEVLTFRCDGSYEEGYELGLTRIEELRRVEAVFAVTDLAAIGLIHAVQQRGGLSVPDDIAVVGYDDSPLAGRLRPRLTTVRQPVEEVAFLTCERLVEMIEDRRTGRPHASRQIALQPRLVERETT